MVSAFSFEFVFRTIGPKMIPAIGATMRNHRPLLDDIHIHFM